MLTNFHIYFLQMHSQAPTQVNRNFVIFYMVTQPHRCVVICHSLYNMRLDAIILCNYNIHYPTMTKGQPYFTV